MSDQELEKKSEAVKPKMAKEEVMVRVQPTPNPMALKFITNFPLKEDDKATVKEVEEVEDVPLARALLSLLGVKQLHFFQNTVTVTYDGQLGEEVLSDMVKEVIVNNMPFHDSHFMTEKIQKKKDNRNRSEAIMKVEEILDRTIRPGLQSDGGDVEVIRYEKDTIEILYQGACGGCPSAMMGTLDAIQNILRYELDNDELIVRPI